MSKLESLLYIFGGENMPRLRSIILPLCLSLLTLSVLGDGKTNSGQPAIKSLDALDQQAKQRVKGAARVSLASETDALFNDIDSFEAAGSGRAPNYLRALAMIPASVKPFAKAFKTYVYGGTIAPEVKLAMGLRIAQAHGGSYLATHLQRLLRATPRGEQILEKIRVNKLDQLTPAESLALRYATLLTGDVHGVSDADFEKTRGSYNDAQIVELTMTVSFFNYFDRFCEALNLPVEPWALDPQSKPQIPAWSANPLSAARIALVSDGEMNTAIAVMAASKDAAAQSSGLGLGIANSQRAMMRVPDIQTAWRAYTTTTRQNASIGRDIQLQISFAVSMANGCRYCTLHQVQGLRRLGVDMAKLQAMQKSDEALTPREKVAVTFARKLTRDVTSITDADYAALKAEFQEKGALESLLQTCNFAYMNRFTDGLRLPSEDEAIRVYREVYGSDFRASR